MRLLPVGFLLGALGCLAAGCGGGKDKVDDARRGHVLRDIFVLYTQYMDANKDQPPSNAQNLQPFAGQHQEGYQALQSGRCVVNWNTRLTLPPETNSNKILAYEKDVPTQGGFVLRGDSTISKMTAQEFATASRAN